MGRLVMFVIAIGIVGFLGYRSMYGRAPTAQGVSEPKQQLDNVKGAAKRIEEQQQKAAEETLKKGVGD